MKQVNYKSDFDFLLRLQSCNGENIGWPDYDWTAKFWTSSKSNTFTARCVGGVAENCFNDNNTIHIVANNHHLSPGQLKVEFTAKLPNKIYPDETERVVTPLPLNIELTNEAAPGRETANVELVMPYVSKGEEAADENTYKRVLRRRPKLGNGRNKTLYLTNLYRIGNTNTKYFDVVLRTHEFLSKSDLPRSIEFNTGALDVADVRFDNPNIKGVEVTITPGKITLTKTEAFRTISPRHNEHYWGQDTTGYARVRAHLGVNDKGGFGDMAVVCLCGKDGKLEVSAPGGRFVVPRAPKPRLNVNLGVTEQGMSMGEIYKIGGCSGRIHIQYRQRMARDSGSTHYHKWKTFLHEKPGRVALTDRYVFRVRFVPYKSWQEPSEWSYFSIKSLGPQRIAIAQLD